VRVDGLRIADPAHEVRLVVRQRAGDDGTLGHVFERPPHIDLRSGHARDHVAGAAAVLREGDPAARGVALQADGGAVGIAAAGQHERREKQDGPFHFFASAVIAR
jgi:hypothetical protein